MSDNKKGDNLKDKAISSSAWGFLDKGSGIVVQFIIGIVLARLLPPEDFGLVGLGMIVIGFGQIFVNLGLGPSLIQKQGLTERHVRVVFTTSVIAGIVLSVIIYLSAPLSALVLDQKNVAPIIESLSIIFLIAGLQIPSRALLKKRLDFRHIFYISLLQSILNGVLTITLALLGFGVWSLVIGNIFQRTFGLIGSYWYVRHSIKPLFAKKEFNDLIHFGSGMTLNGIFNYFALQGDYFMIGRILGAEALGLYTKAYTLMQVPTSKFVTVLSDVLFPTTSKIQNDKERVRKIFLKSIHTIAFITIPMCGLMVLLAPELIIGLYGKNWAGTILPFQILGAFGALRATYNAGGAFLRAQGWVYSLFGANLSYGIVMIVGVWVGAHNFGLNGASWAVGLAIFVIWSMIMELNCRAMNIKRLNIIKSLFPGLLVALFTLLPTFLIAKYIPVESYIIRLFILSMIGVLFLLLSVFLLPQKLLFFIPYKILGSVKRYMPDKVKGSYSLLLNFVTPPSINSQEKVNPE